MIKPTTILLVLSITLTRGWPLRHIDIHSAFPYGPLSETIYMQQPFGFVDPSRPHYVYKLNKVIYGLKQAPRAWFSELIYWLITYSFFASIADPSLFIIHIDTLHMYILVYVDDMVITFF